MVNMYSMGSNSLSNGNVYQYYKNRYGCGYEDFGHKPYTQPYPMAITPRGKAPLTQRNVFFRFLKKYFG